MMLYLMQGLEMTRKEIVAKLVEIQYSRNDIDFSRGNFRIRGDRIDIYLAYEDAAIRVELFGDSIDSIKKIDPITSKTIAVFSKCAIYPASHYVQPKNMMPKTLQMISDELDKQFNYFKKENKLVEAQRLKQRTEHDIEILDETGSCSGVENYSRIMTRRNAGEPPPTLIDYFPKQSLLFLDESHVSLPQIRGMYHGDYSRKKNLVEFGFRLPSALDNRPLKFEEFDKIIKQRIYVSATPGDYEREKSSVTAEQIIRPTGLLDPIIEIRPTTNQVDDMYNEILLRVKKNHRILITTLTKKMAESLSEYYSQLKIKVCYIHSDIDTIERTVILKNLRTGEIDLLIGVNLLREGLDLPEVSLVGIMDADKEGFLRSYRPLMQTCGRASRNADGKVIMYADTITKSMKQTLEETDRRRKIQMAHNKKYQITPQTIQKKIHQALVEKEEFLLKEKNISYGNSKMFYKKIKSLEKTMHQAAKKLDFEKAAQLRDELQEMRRIDLEM